MTEAGAVTTERRHGGSVARLRVPAGPMTARTATTLAAAAEALVEERDVRVVVLDLDAINGAADDLVPTDLRPDPAAAVARLRPPVVAALSGPCTGVGLEIALAADVRVAAADATVALPQVTAGHLPCWGGTQRLPRAVGAARATELVLTGRTLDAVEAETWGIVHHLADDLDAATGAVIHQLLDVGPLAAELAKEAVHRGSELPLRDGLRLEGDLNTLLATTEDRAEGLAAFFDKRPPDFAGR